MRFVTHSRGFVPQAKHVRCEVRAQHLRLEVLTLPAGRTVLVDGELFQEVNAADCSWQLEDAAGGVNRHRPRFMQHKEQ